MRASIAQLVEHRSRKAGVTSSSLVAGSIELNRSKADVFGLFCYLENPLGASRKRRRGLEAICSLGDVMATEKSDR